MKRPSEHITTELAYNLGALFLNFGTLDHTLSITVSAAFQLTDRQERTFVRGMYPRQKVQLLQSFAARHWTEHYQKLLKPLSTKTLALIDYRNDFAHGSAMHDETGEWSLITFRGGDRFDGKAEPIDLKRLKESVWLAQEYAERFQALADATAEGKTAKAL